MNDSCNSAKDGESMKTPVTDKSSNCNTLEACRRTIDDIDSRIVSLLVTRMQAAARTGRIKETAGLPTLDQSRETEVLDRVTALAGEGQDRAFVRQVYLEIIAASRAAQDRPKVSFLGPAGTFTHQAAAAVFGPSASFEPAGRLGEVFSCIERGECTFGVVPAENSYEGSVDLTLDLLYPYEGHIIGEHLMPIRHQLLGNGKNLSSVKRIHSHPMALAQCSRWLAAHTPDAALKEEASTAAAAERAAHDPDAAAIAGAICAGIYGLGVLAADVADDPGNTTRFLILGTQMREPTGADKTSILFSLPHRPGALQAVLTPPAEEGINLSRIDSRPVKGRAWEYLFFVDLEGHALDDGVRRVLERMRVCCTHLRVLGSYPAFRAAGM